MSRIHQFDPECGCWRCRAVDEFIWREAAASVALSHDPRAQTIALEEEQDE